MERVKGIEPSSSAWKAVALPLSYTRGWCLRMQTAEAHGWWAEKDSNLRRREPADLQSAPFGHFGIYPGARCRSDEVHSCENDKERSHRPDSNRRPTVYKTVAL